MSGFEGSFLGAQDKISPKAIMECKICWTPYDPAEGDDTRQVLPGTPFLDLPDDWSCPNCDAPKEQFLVSEDPGAQDVLEAQFIKNRTDLLETDFTEVWHAKMRDLPMVNKVLHVQAVGWQMYQGRPLGVLISPWFMNLVMLPSEHEDWTALEVGGKEDISFASGTYEFIHNVRDMVGGYKACALFSPMGEFKTQGQAVDVAKAVMVALFDAENMADTDRQADIRAAREAEITAADGLAEEPEIPALPSRRQVLTVGVSES